MQEHEHHPGHENAGHPHPPKELTIWIDGQSYDTVDDDQEGAALLRLAGLQPNMYDIARLKPHGGRERFKDTDLIKLHDGDKFVSVRQEASVA